jgi:hypothetical protein
MTNCRAQIQTTAIRQHRTKQIKTTKETTINKEKWNS